MGRGEVSLLLIRLIQRGEVKTAFYLRLDHRYLAACMHHRELRALARGGAICCCCCMAGAVFPIRGHWINQHSARRKMMLRRFFYGIDFLWGAIYKAGEGRGGGGRELFIDMTL